MGVVVRRYIDILTIIINFPYSTCISSFLGQQYHIKPHIIIGLEMLVGIILSIFRARFQLLITRFTKIVYSYFSIVINLVLHSVPVHCFCRN